MKKIAFVNGKGGTGKTTLCALTALAASNAGFKIGIIDTDPQQSIAAWLHNVEPENIEIFQDKEYDVILIDTPPRLDDENFIKHINGATDIFIVSSLSPTDLATSKRTLSILEANNLKDKTKLIINQYKGRTRLAKNQEASLQNFDIPVLKNTIGSRQAYQHAFALGWQALKAKEKEEVAKIILEMFK